VVLASTSTRSSAYISASYSAHQALSSGVRCLLARSSMRQAKQDLSKQSTSPLSWSMLDMPEPLRYTKNSRHELRHIFHRLSLVQTEIHSINSRLQTDYGRLTSNKHDIFSLACFLEVHVVATPWVNPPSLLQLFESSSVTEVGMLKLDELFIRLNDTVAVSRVSKLQGLMFDVPFDRGRVCRDPPSRGKQASRQFRIVS
jgi:hypothetical protein